MTYRTEAELARVVVGWLRGRGFEVWQEVDGFYDILATKRDHLWAIETKLHFGAPVLAQAWRRKGSVHFVSVGTPPGPKDMLTRSFLTKVAKDNGIGVLRVSGAKVVEKVAPKLRRVKGSKLQQRLASIPQDYAQAGTNRGGYWTAFKGTCEKVVRYVSKHPGCSINEVVGAIDHHYASKASARARLTMMCEQGVVEVDAVRDGKALLLYPVKR